MILQDFSILLVNYRGTRSYGKEFMQTLLGHIGDKDVEDCANLTIKCLKENEDKLDSKKVFLFGLSHGGHITGRLIGHPEYKDMWTAASLWNPVINMSHLMASIDVPDLVIANCFNESLDFASYSVEQNQILFEKSTIFHIRNVRTPSIFLIGQDDCRVPP
jgi:acylaminoacyl-peptidase